MNSRSVESASFGCDRLVHERPMGRYRRKSARRFPVRRKAGVDKTFLHDPISNK
jgi:hypothetical protein